MGVHVIIGAGPVGETTARALVELGHDVRVVTRRGLGPHGEGIRRVATDATDVDGLAGAARGADVLYNCANPAYHRWATDWPPIGRGILGAAERLDAGLVTMSNVYGYAPGTVPMRESSPIEPANDKCAFRARMWDEVLVAHRAGRVRATEARASDFFGPGVTQAIVGSFTMHPLLAGRTVRVLGRSDVVHSMTYVPDVGRLLARLGTDDQERGAAWGQAWHVPTAPAVTQAELFGALATALGRPRPTVRSVPPFVLRAAGVVARELGEMRHVAYQTSAPFVLDSSHTEATFGLAPTPWDEAITTTARWWADQAGTATATRAAA